MVISQENLIIFGFHAICYPQVKFFKKLCTPNHHAQRPPKSSKTSKLLLFGKFSLFLIDLKLFRMLGMFLILRFSMIMGPQSAKTENQVSQIFGPNLTKCSRPRSILSIWWVDSPPQAKIFAIWSLPKREFPCKNSVFGAIFNGKNSKIEKKVTPF